MQLRRLLSETGQAFDRDRVMAPALGLLAYRMLSGRKSALAVDDGLLDELSQLLQDIYQRYYRRRNVLPADWSAEMFIRDVARSPVVDLDQRTGSAQYMTFSQARFADWYAAWHVDELARSGADVTLAVTELANVGAEGALAQLVDADPDGTKYVDVIATINRPIAERVWVAGNLGRKAPSSMQREFDRLITDLSDEWARQKAGPGLNSHAGMADPRRRLQIVNRWPCLETLLDLAADLHPLVSGAAEYELLHSAEDVGSLLAWDPRKGTLAFEASGAGQATIAGLRLLAVPSGSVTRLSVTIHHLEIDPFDSPDNVLRMLPQPAAAATATLLSASEGQDWLRSVATACVASRLSHDHAAQAEHHGQLADLAGRLIRRAIDQAALAKVISEDLGLKLPDLPTTPDATVDGAWHSYARLRHSFGPPALETRAAILSASLDVQQSVGTVSGSMTGIETSSLSVQSRYADGYYTDDLARINLSTTAKEVKGGSVRGLAIGTLQGSNTALPIRLRVNISISVNVVKEGTIGGIVVNRIEGPHPSWEANCSITIKSMTGNSTLLGVIAGENAGEGGAVPALPD
jgi:hypothetical protein